MEYIIVNEENIGAMQTAVNAQIKEGYKPWGDLICKDANTCWMYIQAMVRRDVTHMLAGNKSGAKGGK